MAWQDDLAGLLGDVAEGAGTTTQRVLHQDPRDTLGQGLGFGAEKFFGGMNLPMTAVKYGTGALLGGINEGLGHLPGQPGYYPEQSKIFHEQGPLAEFEAVRAREYRDIPEPLNKLFQTATELGLDPVNYVGLGAATKLAEGARLGAEAAQAGGRPFLAGGLRGAETMARGTNLLFNEAPSAATRLIREAPPVRAATAKIAASRIGQAAAAKVQQATALAPRYAVGQDFSNTVNAWFSEKSAGPMQEVNRALTHTPEGVPLEIPLDEHGLPIGLDQPYHPDVVAAMQRRGFNPLIGSEEDALLRTPLKDGTSRREFVTQYSKEGGEAQQLLHDAGAKWDAFSTLEERKKAVNNDPALSKLIDKWHKLGVDPLHAVDSDHIGLALLERQMSKDAGIKVAAQSTVPQLLAAGWGEQVLASPKQLLNNVFGNVLMAGIAGHRVPLTPGEYLTQFKLERGGLDAVAREEALASLKVTQTSQKWGFDQAPQETMNGLMHDIRSNTNRFTPSHIGELTGRATSKVIGEGAGRAVGKKVGAPFLIQRDLGQAAETVARSSIYGDTFDRRMTEMLPDWEAAVRASGAPDFSVANDVDQFAGGMHTDALRQTLIDKGIKPGDATHLVRSFANIRSKARRDGIAEMHRILFSYQKTNLDEWVGKFVPFHYWYSRALRFYAEEAVRHPYLALSYMRANKGIEEAQNDPGLSARQKGFIGLFGTPMGFTLLMNPDALFGITKIFNMEDDYQEDGQTALGGALSWLKNYGFGLYPWLDGTLNLMGIYGNTFEPDLLGLRHKALVGSAIRLAGTAFGFQAGSPYQDAMGQLRYSVSSFTDALTPDWLTQTVTPRPGGSAQEASLDSMIESAILAQNPNLTNEQMLGILTDPESPEYQEAYRQAAEAGIIQQLLSFTLPASFKMREPTRDVRLAQTSTIYDAAMAAGVQPGEYLPTEGDLAFRGKYKALTGKEFQPGDYDRAKFLNDLTKAPPENKEFIVNEYEYNSLGTAKQQKDYHRYTDLLFGNDPLTAGIEDPAQRREIANRWADRHARTRRSVTDMYTMRDAYAGTHPQVAQFKDWASRVRNVGVAYGSLAEYRRRASQASPNAARYFAQQEAYIKAHYPIDQWPKQLDDATVSAAAYLNITGQGSANINSPGGFTSRSEQGPMPGYPGADLALPALESAAPAPTNWFVAAQSL